MAPEPHRYRRDSPPLPLSIGDVLVLRKGHPCGSDEWTVIRLGADIGIRCSGCGRRVLLPRRELERRIRTIASRAEVVEPDQQMDEAKSEW